MPSKALGITATNWGMATDETKGRRAGVAADALKAGEALPGLRAVRVAGRGTLVAERHHCGATAEILQPTNTATQTVCSMLWDWHCATVV